jgi:hypothetical protein
MAICGDFHRVFNSTQKKNKRLRRVHAARVRPAAPAAAMLLTGAAGTGGSPAQAAGPPEP